MPATAGRNAQGETVVTRWALALLLAYIAIVGGPSPSAPVIPVPSVSTPSSAMRTAVEPVAQALKAANAADRALFADVWQKAAKVVRGDATTREVVFTDTRSLREFARIAAVIGWQRIGGHQAGKFPALDVAVDQAFGAAMGFDSKAVDDTTRQRFVELCDALAWAGINRG